MLYVVSYELATQLFRNTSAFTDEIQRSRSWMHYIDNTWIISTDETIEQLYSRLREHLIDQDLLLIMNTDGISAGWLPEEAWNWIQERINAGESFR